MDRKTGAPHLPAVEQARRIDIWWRGHRGNLGLMLALAFLLKKDEAWSGAETIVWRVVESEDEILPSATQLETLLDEARFDARVQVVAHDGNVFSTIRRHSRQAGLLFMGLRPKLADEALEDYATYYAGLCRQTEGLPPTALVNAGRGSRPAPIVLRRFASPSLPSAEPYGIIV